MKQKKLTIKVVFLITILAIVGWSCAVAPESYPADTAEYNTLHTGWSQVIDGEEIPLENIQDFIQVDKGENLVFTCTMPEVKDGDVFLFYSWNQEVYAYIDGVCIHDFSMQEGFEFLKTPGSAWNQIDLTADMSGGTLVFVLGSSVNGIDIVASNIYLIDDVDVGNARIYEIGFRIFAAVLLFFLSAFAYISAKIWKKETRINYYLSLGRVYLCLFLWLLAELNVYELIFHRPITSYLLSMIFIRMLPIALCDVMLPKTVLPEKWRKMIKGITIGNFFGAFLLQFVCGISLLTTLFIDTAIILMILVICGWKIIRSLMQWDTIKKDDHYYLLFGLLVMGGLMDCIVILGFDGPHRYSGIYSTVACLLYFFITYIMLSNRNSKTVIEKAELEEHYQKLQTISLMEQMKSHFIFNTLNGISELCKRAGAKEADDAVKLFAKYLRSYMYLINQHENISFEKEMELVGAYLRIEKMRFEENLEFDLNLTCTDFVVPPLSIQPFVENAVIHGVRQRDGIGSIMVSSKEYRDCVEIIIEDNGVGFDVNELEGNSGVAITNVKQRVAVLVKGSIDIQSQINRGTRVKITIPLSKAE